MRIYPETFDFLRNLVENNNRDWFMAHKADHDRAKENVIEFAGELIKELSQIDPSLDRNLDPKKAVMRIYRDIRFSTDKTPYKNNFAIGRMTTSGNTVLHVGYYMHIQPGGSFVAGGSWMPEADQLKKIRQEIDYNAAELKKIIDAPEFKKLFGEFRNQEQLKTVPQGYSPDNENIALLKLKCFVAETGFTDKEMQKEGIVQRIAEVCSKIYPLNIFLKNAVS
ncbi:MAG TPA: DUF2461 domain-containing protein [Mucilaginibacter sp.]|jgi:uncharacterized protein (TIGR02453 family)|nr:DUF2461 domain-containing protein [Mucilaginibacter sp.]